MELIITKPIEELRNFIATHYQTELDIYTTEDYPLYSPVSKHIKITQPDFDNKKQPKAVCFIVPQGGSIETEVVDAHSELDVNMYMFFSGEKQETLQMITLKQIEIFTNWILKNRTLNQSIDNVEILDYDIYIDGVEGKENLSGFMMNMKLEAFITI